MFMKTYFTPDGIGASWMNIWDEDFLTRKCPILPDQRAVGCQGVDWIVRLLAFICTTPFVVVETIFDQQLLHARVCLVLKATPSDSIIDKPVVSVVERD